MTSLDQPHAPHDHTRRVLLRRGLLLEYITLGWNVAGVVVLGYAALASNSVALAGFSFDSLIEIFASIVVVWHLNDTRANEKITLRLIGLSFLALAVYIAVQIAYMLISGGQSEPSLVGMIWLLVTVIVMLLLARGKAVTGKRLNNPVLMSEAKVTVIDGYLAGAVLIGVAINSVLGWWWADPVSGLAVLFYALFEGVAHWREGGGAK